MYIVHKDRKARDLREKGDQSSVDLAISDIFVFLKKN